MQSPTPEPFLIHRNEQRYFILAVLFSVISYLVLIFSVIGIVFMLIFIGLPLFFHALFMGWIRSNGVRLSENQFPQVYEKTRELCVKMGIPTVPDVYILESGGVLNAFATRFFGRNMVVLYSNIFELIDSGEEDELTFVIAHELAHIKRKHISKQLLILPAMWIPFLGEAYSRACEYTCDRYAAYYTGNEEAAKNGLTILAVGKVLYKHVNRQEYLHQSSMEQGFFVWLSEMLSTHPTLPKRIYEIERFSNQGVSVTFKKPKVLWALFPVLLIGLVFYIWFSDEALARIQNAPVWAELGLSETTPLTGAAWDDNTEEVRALLSAGSDPNVIEAEGGWTALMYAAENGNKEMVQDLLKAGADPSLRENNTGETALFKACTVGNGEIVEILLESGADPNAQDNYGYTPLISAAMSGNKEAVKLLLDKGADPSIKNEDQKTALSYAEESYGEAAGYQEIVEILKGHHTTKGK